MASKRIEFKSFPALYKKEYLGLKRNTIRKQDKKDDIRFELLNDFITLKLTNLSIRIIQSETTESFERTITDVTKFDDYYIISW